MQCPSPRDGAVSSEQSLCGARGCVWGKQEPMLKLIFSILWCFLHARLIAALTALHCPAVTKASYQHQICFQRAATPQAPKGRCTFTERWFFTNHHHAA